MDRRRRACYTNIRDRQGTLGTAAGAGGARDSARNLGRFWTRPLDHLIAAYLAKQGVAQPIPVNSAEFARRAYLDIWGLLPTPEETRSFVASTDPNKRNKLVASLLDSPTRYSEHWVSYWNDLLRNDEGVAYIAEIAQRKSITPWLLDALEKNKPYNQMVWELLNTYRGQRPRGLPDWCQLAWNRERIADAAAASVAERRADFPGHQLQMQFLP